MPRLSFLLNKGNCGVGWEGAIIIIIIIIIVMLLLLFLLLLVTVLFSLELLLLKQRWPQPLMLQFSVCTTDHIMCHVPSIAAFCSEYIELYYYYYYYYYHYCY